MKRKQHPLPGRFSTALEAAQYLAWVKIHHKEWETTGPPKQIETRKQRSKKQPAQPAAEPPPAVVALQMPMATTMAIPVPMPLLNAPLVAVSPVPMQQLGYVPPFRSTM